MELIGKRWFTAMIAGGVALAAIQGCTPPPSPGPPMGVRRHLVMKDHQRDAEGGGTVTVDVTVYAVPVPDINMPSGSVIVAEFSNRGENGKKEKRYEWKPKGPHNIRYQLVLSADRNKNRTKWEMVEVNGLTLARVSHKSGHLWICDKYPHPPTALEVDFKLCSEHVEYGPKEIAGKSQGASVRFVSQFTSEDAESLLAGTPVWISCNSGCCSLGREVQ